MATAVRDAPAAATGASDGVVPGRSAPAWRGPALTAAAYLLASAVLYHRLLAHLATTTVGWTSSDSYQFVWWMSWLPWSLAHGANPLYTTYLHAPLGVNAMWNTPASALAVLFAPLTRAAGPVVAYNVAMVLGPVVSGLALASALRVWVARWWPRAVAGLLYGFSPFVVEHVAVGHVNLVWAVLPPVLVWAVHALLVTPEPRPWRDGALVGVAFALQTVLYTQTVALCAVVLVVVALVLAVRFPRAAAARLPVLLRAAGAALATYVVLAAYPLYLLVAGPGRPRARIRVPDATNADAANLLVPTSTTRLQLGLAALADRLHTHAGEQGGYVGAALLAVTVAAAVAVRRARFVALVGLAAWVASLGVSLVVLGRDTRLPLPWRALAGLPLVGEVETMRFQVVVALCVAVAVALWCDHLADAPPGLRRGVAVAGTALAALTWLPADGPVVLDTDVPAFFTAGAPGLTAADVVETYPRSSSAWTGGARPMLWQAASRFAYRAAGGYFIGSDPRNDLLTDAPPTRYQMSAVDVVNGAPSPPDVTAARDELRVLGVTAVVVVPEGGDVGALLDLTRRVTGGPGQQVGGVWLFRLPPP